MDAFFRSLRKRQLNGFRIDRERTLDRALKRLGRARLGSGAPYLALTDAVYGWGNEGWSADEDYLRRLMSEATAAKGTILECGSGLSTLLIAGIAKQTGVAFHSLEHNAEWRKRVTGALSGHALTAYSTVHYAPLQSYGQFDWYSIPDSLPANISLIICDGPPSDTVGGRHGVVPALRSRMARTCTILMDDANRSGEVEIMEQWERDFSTVSERFDTEKGFARVTVTT
ncbi:MAG TPA: hypothetical protein VN602_06995 [Gemmatimonadaceae bacterium]|nr:hypothetical protein [Gemmatimonadaceae bacterium]